MRKAVKILKWGFVLGYFPVMLSFVAVSHRSVVCSDIRVYVKDSMDARFIDAADIRKLVIDKNPSLLGEPVRNLNFEELENFVKRNSSVRTCEVFNSGSGVINIVLTQYKPIVRVLAANGSFYLDSEGHQIPVSSRFSARVLVANGTLPTDKTELLNVARLIASDPFWEAQFEQIYVRKNNDYVLVPRVGDHLILLGPPDEVEKKLRNLRALYQSGLDPREWNEYKVINLKFMNQVICSRSRLL